ncbi:zinc finger protein OZF-like [Entelurus aequoreus]|uniref:zinc finger protein OZF-like n=1 Tax=Entelurus aequoreus TaxID=161455 RepID=UPI002B1DA2BF|nr:zinc finger protein OZF-like [Entelurus aequoreus]
MCERTIAEYAKDISTIKKENEQQHQLLDTVFMKHQVVLHRTDVQQPLHIKEEEEELWITQEEERLLGQKEADLTKFPLTVVSVKTEDHEEKPPESSQLHHRPNLQQLISRQDDRLTQLQVGSFTLKQEDPQPSHVEDLTNLHLTGVSVKTEADDLLAPLSDSDDATSHSSEDEDRDNIQEPWSCDTKYESDKVNKHSECSEKETRKEYLTCSVCDKRFTQKGTLNRHMRIHTGEKLLICSVCGKKFSQIDLTRHMRTHTGEKPFSCSICGDGFAVKSHMTSHMRTHTGEKPHSCSFCAKTFSRRDTLIVHMRTHNGEKPFKCSVCGKQFSQRSNIASHMRTHTGEKPFSCSVCAEQFSQKSNMVSHMRTHTQERPFGCSLCSHAFSRCDNLTQHMLTHKRRRTL